MAATRPCVYQLSSPLGAKRCWNRGIWLRRVCGRHFEASRESAASPRVRGDDEGQGAELVIVIPANAGDGGLATRSASVVKIAQQNQPSRTSTWVEVLIVSMLSAVACAHVEPNKHIEHSRGARPRRKKAIRPSSSGGGPAAWLRTGRASSRI